MCSLKTIFKIMLAIAAALLAAYALFPPLRLAVASLGPYLLFLGCPLAMLVMMSGMQNPQQPAAGETREIERAQPREGSSASQ